MTRRYGIAVIGAGDMGNRHVKAWNSLATTSCLSPTVVTTKPFERHCRADLFASTECLGLAHQNDRHGPVAPAYQPFCC